MTPHPSVKIILYLIVYILGVNISSMLFFGYHESKVETIANIRLIMFAIYVALMEWFSGKEDD